MTLLLTPRCRKLLITNAHLMFSKPLKLFNELLSIHLCIQIVLLNWNSSFWKGLGLRLSTGLGKMFAFLEEAGRHPCEEYNRSLQSILGRCLGFSPCGCDKKYPDKSNLREKELTWLTISDYIPLFQGSQGHRSLKQLGTSHLQWRAEWSEVVFSPLAQSRTPSTGNGTAHSGWALLHQLM